MKFQTPSSLLAMAFAALVPAPFVLADASWIGFSGGLWSNPLSWSGVAPGPTGATNAGIVSFGLFVAGPFVVDGTYTVSELVIEEGTSGLTFADGGGGSSLTITGWLTQQADGDASFAVPVTVDSASGFVVFSNSPFSGGGSNSGNGLIFNQGIELTSGTTLGIDARVPRVSFSATVEGRLTGAGNLQINTGQYVVVPATLDLRGDNTFTGDLRSRGVVVVRDDGTEAGALSGIDQVFIEGLAGFNTARSRLIIGESDINLNPGPSSYTSRISDDAQISLRAGELTLINSIVEPGPVTEVIAATRLEFGHSAILLTNHQANDTGALTLSSTIFSLATGATAFVAGNTDGGSPSLGDGTGVSGATRFVSAGLDAYDVSLSAIVPFLVGTNGGSINEGSDATFVRYYATETAGKLGLAPVAFSDYASTLVGADATTLVNITANESVTAPTSIAALRLDFADVDINNQTLTIGSSIILETGALFGSGEILLNSGDLVTQRPVGIFSQGNSNSITASLAGLVDLTYAGPGDLSLSSFSTYAGRTWLATSISSANGESFGVSDVHIAKGVTLSFVPGEGATYGNDFYINGGLVSLRAENTLATLNGAISIDLPNAGEIAGVYFNTNVFGDAGAGMVINGDVSTTGRADIITTASGPGSGGDTEIVFNGTISEPTPQSVRVFGFGGGTTVLNANNTYGGGTSFLSGELRIGNPDLDAGSATGSGDVFITTQSGLITRLTGQGRMAGNVSLQGSTIAPGGSFQAGVMVLGSDLSFAVSGDFNTQFLPVFEVDLLAGSSDWQLSENDRLEFRRADPLAAANLLLGPAAELSINMLNAPLFGDVFRIVSTDSSLGLSLFGDRFRYGGNVLENGQTFIVNSLFDGPQVLQITYGSNFIDLAAIPEPATAVGLAGLAALSLTIGARRRRAGAPAPELVSPLA